VNLRWRLALISSFVTLMALAALVIGSGLLLERVRLRDLDEELGVQAKVVMDEIADGTRSELSLSVVDALSTATGSSVAWVYQNGQLMTGDGINAPEPLEPSFFGNLQTMTVTSHVGWRVYSLRRGAMIVQIGRSLEPLERVTLSYWRIGSAIAVLAALLAGITITVAVNRVTEPLERLARRVQTLESDAPIPALDLRDEVGALARALEGSLSGLRRTRARETRFLADAAHELRTPVTALLTDLEHHNARTRSSAEDHAILKRSTRTARHLRDLASNLLTLSQTERGLELRDVDMFNVAANVVDRIASLAAQKGLEISLDGHPAPAHGDAVALERAVENLIGNAIKFTDSGAVRVTVGSEGNRVQLEVIDTGIGMDADLLETVFAAFERGTETRREGSGLGLAVVKSVVDAHGGTVTLHQNAPHGVRAVVSLPRA